jgi:hypothetical protein
MDAQMVEGDYTNPQQGVSLNCQNVADIPDSEFELPAGAVLDPNV